MNLNSKNIIDGVVCFLRDEPSRIVIDTSFEDQSFYTKNLFYKIIKKIEDRFKKEAFLLSMNHYLVDRKKILYYNFCWGLYPPSNSVSFGDKFDFTYLCGYPRKDKIQMLSNLFKYGLLENALWSCGSLDKINFSIKNLELPNLPKVLDYDKAQKAIPFCWNSINIDFYKDSRFSLVQETEMVSYSNRYTEKTYKSIAIKHPFIVAGNYGVLKALRREGFKTFHPFINESYDDIKNRDERICLIIREVMKLCIKDEQSWQLFIEKIQPILDYNYIKYKSNYEKAKLEQSKHHPNVNQ